MERSDQIKLEDYTRWLILRHGDVSALSFADRREFMTLLLAWIKEQKWERISDESPVVG